jgi:preprotein translocase subunit SecD
MDRGYRNIIFFVICFILSVFCAGCGSTHYTVRNTSYNEVWQASLKVRDGYRPMDTTVERFGATVFETKDDKERGTISFATGEALISHIENTIVVTQLRDGDVRLSVRSVDRTFFLPWLDRKKKSEEEILRKIRKTLGLPGTGVFEVRLVKKDTPADEFLLPEGDVILASGDVSDIVLEHTSKDEPHIVIVLNKDARKRFNEVIQQNIGENLAVITNSRIIAIEAIKRGSGNNLILTGPFTDKEALEAVKKIWIYVFGGPCEYDDD